ncbi:MAG TPA: dTMP kinase [Gemmataceae bacterium]|nr:dTMP kinase [Gemmataceae bacterium]
MPQPLFLSLDGLDGAGKSTQCRLLAEWLEKRGVSVTRCADPGGTEIGDVLRNLLLDQRRHMTLACEAFLFMASRAQLTAEVIRPALAAGRTVLSDRFLLANVVYQGHAGGLDPEQVRSMCLLATEGLEPHLTFVLDLPIEQALARRQGPRTEWKAGRRTFMRGCEPVSAPRPSAIPTALSLLMPANRWTRSTNVFVARWKVERRRIDFQSVRQVG